MTRLLVLIMLWSGCTAHTARNSKKLWRVKNEHNNEQKLLGSPSLSGYLKKSCMAEHHLLQMMPYDAPFIVTILEKMSLLDKEVAGRFPSDWIACARQDSQWCSQRLVIERPLPERITFPFVRSPELFEQALREVQACGIPLDQTDSYGSTALMYYARGYHKNYTLACKFLIDAKARIDLQNDEKQTALSIALDTWKGSGELPQYGDEIARLIAAHSGFKTSVNEPVMHYGILKNYLSIVLDLPRSSERNVLLRALILARAMITKADIMNAFVSDDTAAFETLARSASFAVVDDAHEEIKRDLQPAMVQKYSMLLSPIVASRTSSIAESFESLALLPFSFSGVEAASRVKTAAKSYSESAQ